MNERIKELAEQAGVDAGQTIANTICGDDEWVALGNEFNKLSQKTRDLIYKTLEQNQEKFAELIINECIDQVAGSKIVAQVEGDEIVGLSESADNKYKQWNNALVIATMNVRDHFGIEE